MPSRRRVVLVIAFGILAIATWAEATAQERLTQTEFVARAIATFEAAGAVDVTRAGALALRFTMPETDPATANLNNAWQAYLVDPSNPDAIISHYVGTITRAIGQAQAPIDRTRIVPVIRHTEFLADMMSRSSEGAKSSEPRRTPSHAVLNRELVLLFAEDGDTRMRFLAKADVADLRLEPEALFAMALNNLFARLPGIDRRGKAGVMIVQADGNFESSLILAEGLFTPVNFPVKGDPVFAVPSRDVLLVTGLDDPEGLFEMRAMAADLFAESPYAISDQLFIRAPDGNIRVLE